MYQGHGHLFDVAPDGVGYILDTENKLSHVFTPENLHPPTADWASLEGRRVFFSVWDGVVTRVDLV